MYLKSIQIHGFKSFADKTRFEFAGQNSANNLPLTAIVGPNGSGKSNVADAARWVLGEQSIKAVRGKKSEDVIFSGSARRARTAYAEVELAVDNTDGRLALDTPEVLIARRLWRDGQSEYLLNNKVTRLMDIQMLLAQASFGKEGYSVIGQGQIDAILVASAEERKTFFDEATGVRPLQIKKEQTLKKLATTEETLNQALLLKEEIEPRLRSLTRQVRRLEQREEVEKELHELQTKYYGVMLLQGGTDDKKWQDLITKTQEAKNLKTQELQKIEAEMQALEKSETKPVELLKLQVDYEKLIASKERLRDREFELKRKLLEAKKDASAMPTHEIVQNLEGIRLELSGLSNQTTPLTDIIQRVTTLFQTVSNLISRLKGEAAPKNAATFTQELEEIAKDLSTTDQDLEKLRSELQRLGRASEEKKQSFFEIQRKLSAKQSEVHVIESELGNAKIELAKIETRRETLITEATQEMGERFNELQNQIAAGNIVADNAFENATLLPDILRLKRQLEIIGGVDEETKKEFQEVSTRHAFLLEQTTDLENSLKSLVSLLEELDQSIKIQFEKAFEKINQEFGNYFKVLFGGGSAKLSKLVIKEEEKEEGEQTENTPALITSPQSLTQQQRPSILDKFTKKDSYRGIEISATPPGKKLRSITMLSGGEKALTSIALLSAILALNPPPFVILDEVDAALDESNSARFASILAELSQHSQFVVITHNRATMHAAEALYGITMGDDGVSKVLSLKIDDKQQVPVPTN